jgi:hypothetical protein
MAKSINTAAITIGAVGLVAIVYFITKKSSTTTTPPYVQPPSSEVQQSQLLAWAMNQQNGTWWQDLIKGLSVSDLVNLWDSIFGSGNSGGDYSGGGDESNYGGDIWV